MVALGRDCEMLAVLPLAPRPRLLAAPALSATPGRLPVLTAAASTQLPADGRRGRVSSSDLAMFSKRLIGSRHTIRPLLSLCYFPKTYL